MLTTSRLLLRRWQTSDLAPFATLNADVEVMRYFPYRLSRQASDAFVEHIEANFEQYGFGLWAVELQATGAFIGFIGLKEANFRAHFTPKIEGRLAAVAALLGSWIRHRRGEARLGIWF